MTPRAAARIDQLRLEPHPEGGYYREVFRAEAAVQPDDDRTDRAAVTTIYFLLTADDHSAWHQLRSDEVWHFYEGAPLDLYRMEPTFDTVQRLRLGPVDPIARPVAVIPAGAWQAARSTGAYTLVGCTMGPGFDGADFRLLRDTPKVDAFRAAQPGWTDLL
jgi:predicted cupin superfamily sugar epimerase